MKTAPTLATNHRDPGMASAGRHIMAFELEHSGHRPGYLLNLARFWHERELPGKLDIVVSQAFAARHENVIDEVHGFGNPDLQFVTMTADEFSEPHEAKITTYLRGWKLFCEYAKRLAVDHALLTDFDFFQLPSVIGGQPPCPYSCIYFRPTFHYFLIEGHRVGWKERLTSLRKRWLLYLALRRPQFDTLFSLDPIAANYLAARVPSTTCVTHLPDPVQSYGETEGDVDRLRSQLEIEQGRKVFLLLGTLDRRKGIVQLLQACQTLSNQELSEVSLVLVGPIHATQDAEVAALVTQLTTETPIQIVVVNQFVEDRHIQKYIRIADAVLATYQRHIGMSAILVRAATAGLPVLASNYGLMGALVRERKLGVDVDSTDPAAIADGMRTFLDSDPDTLFDQEEAYRFGDENTAARTGQTLWGRLLATKARSAP